MEDYDQEDMRETINAIKELRLSQNPPMRQVDLGVRLGIGRGEVSRYENGVVQPTLRRAFEIALIFRVPVERVFHGLIESVEGQDGPV